MWEKTKCSVNRGLCLFTGSNPLYNTWNYIHENHNIPWDNGIYFLMIIRQTHIKLDLSGASSQNGEAMAVFLLQREQYVLFMRDIIDLEFLN